MKILAAGDIHGDLRKINELAKKAEKENVDIVVLCGDITHDETKTKNLIGPFVKKNKKVLLIPGNHETIATADFLAEMYNITNLHGYSIRHKDIGFFGCGLANIGVSQLDEEDIFNILKQSNKYLKDVRKRIMVTHVHPQGSLIEKFTTLVPSSTGVRKAIEKLKPDFLLCSHVHEAAGIEDKIGKTKIFNVGREGKIIEI